MDFFFPFRSRKNPSPILYTTIFLKALTPQVTLTTCFIYNLLCPLFLFFFCFIFFLNNVFFFIFFVCQAQSQHKDMGKDILSILRALWLPEMGNKTKPEKKSLLWAA